MFAVVLSDALVSIKFECSSVEVKKEDRRDESSSIDQGGGRAHSSWEKRIIE